MTDVRINGCRSHSQCSSRPSRSDVSRCAIGGQLIEATCERRPIHARSFPHGHHIDVVRAGPVACSRSAKTAVEHVAASANSRSVKWSSKARSGAGQPKPGSADNGSPGARDRLGSPENGTGLASISRSRRRWCQAGLRRFGSSLGPVRSVR